MRRFALASALFVGGLLVCPVTGLSGPPAEAQDKDGDKEKDQKEKERQRVRRQTLKAIAVEFGARDAPRLVQRIPRNEKVTLRLDKEGSYSAAQARGVLDNWFKDLEKVSVRTDSKDVEFDGNAGRFPLTVRRTGEKKERTGTLIVTVGGAGADFPLVKLSVDL